MGENSFTRYLQSSLWILSSPTNDGDVVASDVTNWFANVTFNDTTLSPTTNINFTNTNVTATNSSNHQPPSSQYSKRLIQLSLLGCLFLAVPLVTSLVVVLQNYLFCCCLLKNKMSASFKRTFSKHTFLCKFTHTLSL